MDARSRQLAFSVVILVVLISVVVALALIASDLTVSQASSRAIPSETGRFEVRFCPADDCEALLLALIGSSSQAKCAFYDVDDEEVVRALRARGADVLVFEESYDGFGTSIPAVHGGLMHDKFCVFDSRTVLTGSLNPTSGMEGNRNNVVVIAGERIAENYLQEWDELAGGSEENVPHPLINHTDPSNSSFIIETYFCPEDGCEARLVSLLASANSSIRFMTYSFTSDAVGDALVARFAAGVDVAGVMEPSQESRYSESTGLRAVGIPVIIDDRPGLLHHKVFIVDERIVVTGSYNPTANGNERNDENMLIIHDAGTAELFTEEFYLLSR